MAKDINIFPKQLSVSSLLATESWTEFSLGTKYDQEDDNILAP